MPHMTGRGGPKPTTVSKPVRKSPVKSTHIAPKPTPRFVQKRLSEPGEQLVHG